MAKFSIAWAEYFEAEVEAETEQEAKTLILDGIITGNKMDEEILDVFPV